MVKLFVGGFPLKTDEMELAKIFSLHGDVKTIKIVRDKRTRVSKGYGFIEVGDQASADNIIEMLNGYEIGDKILVINIRPDEEATPAFRPRTSQPARFSPRVPRTGPSDFKPKRPRKRL
jgi:RNA recognition motif-containing protein